MPPSTSLREVISTRLTRALACEPQKKIRKAFRTRRMRQTERSVIGGRVTQPRTHLKSPRDSYNLDEIHPYGQLRPAPFDRFPCGRSFRPHPRAITGKVWACRLPTERDASRLFSLRRIRLNAM